MRPPPARGRGGRPRAARRGRVPARRRRARARSSTSAAMSRKPIRPSRNAGDGDLVRGVVGARIRAAALAGLAGEREHAERLEVRLEELERRGAKVERRDRRRGALGVGQRVGDRHAHVGVAEVRDRAPSRKRTRPWTIDVGWTTTSIRSYGSPKRKCASITSRPLFASVAESIVIFAPIDQVGCASASLGRDVGELVARAAAERAAARRQDDALRLAERRALEERRVLAVDRDQEPAAALAGGERELAGGDEALLVRERERDAVLERPHRRGQARRSRPSR